MPPVPGRWPPDEGWPAAFRGRAVTVPAGGSRAFDVEEWRGALIVVSVGEVDLECPAGLRRRFPRGSVLWFDGLDLCAIHCVGAEPAVLLAISRR